MKREVYKSVVEVIRSEEWDFDLVLSKLEKQFNSEKPDTLRSILNQEYQNQVKKTHTKIKNKKEEIFTDFIEAIQSPNYKNGVIIQIAKEYRFSPSLTGKIIVEQWYPEAEDKQIKQFVINSALIDHPILATEIWLANLKDNNYGFSSNCIKSAIGLGFESKAKKKLEGLGISYQDEHELRAKGYDKTPDFKLVIPFAYQGHVINWIESKALFGDEEKHNGYLKEQLWSYWNRYGPGMVIYWFGFIDEIDNNRDKGIVVCDHFPEDIVLADPLGSVETIKIED